MNTVVLFVEKQPKPYTTVHHSQLNEDYQQMTQTYSQYEAGPSSAVPQSYFGSYEHTPMNIGNYEADVVQSHSQGRQVEDADSDETDDDEADGQMDGDEIDIVDVDSTPLPELQNMFHHMADAVNREPDSYVHEAIVSNELPPLPVLPDLRHLPDIEPDENWIEDSVIGNVDERIAAYTEYDNLEDGRSYWLHRIFSTKKDLLHQLKEWHLRKSVQFKVLTSGPKRFSAACLKKECEWKIHASYSQSKECFQVKKYKSEHTCSNEGLLHDHVQCDAGLISNMILATIRTNITITPAEIQALVKTHYFIDIKYDKAWYARKKALEQVYGVDEASYRNLRRFMSNICTTNPGTVVEIQTQRISHNIEQFQRVFWSFAASIEGFQYCRPVLSIDGTHLFGKFEGTLLIAMGTDANSGLFPLAFAVVEKESGSSWQWFLSILASRVCTRDRLCIISDRFPGLTNIVKNFSP